MKKSIAIMTLALILAARGVYANNANQMKYVEILSAESATLIATNLTLIAPAGVTNNQAAVTSGEKTIGSYPDTILLQVAFGTGPHATYTGTVNVAWGTASGVYETTNTYTHTGTTAGSVRTVEIDTGDLKGTNENLYVLASFGSLCGGAETAEAKAAVNILYEAARADQTIAGSAIDTAAYKGNSTIIVSAGNPRNLSSAYTNTVTIQHSTTGTNGWTTITNLAGTVASEVFTGASCADIEQIAVDLGALHRYMRAVSVQKNDAGPAGVILVAPMKSE